MCDNETADGARPDEEKSADTVPGEFRAGENANVGYLPSPEEIAAQLQEIQATWSDYEQNSRLRVDLRPVHWRPPGANRTLRLGD